MRGIKLPKRLRDFSFKKNGNLTSKWGDALYDTCGLNSSDWDFNDLEIGKKTKIPEEFKTDEWWKKRGL